MTNIISGSTAHFKHDILKKCPLLPKLIEISKVITLDSNEMMKKRFYLEKRFDIILTKSSHAIWR